MTKLLTTFCACLFVISLFAQNRITVSNSPSVVADYDNLQSAVTAANDGDVIYLYGSGQSYGTVRIANAITIYGPGYFLGQNYATGENQVPSSGLVSARIDSVVINVLGSNSALVGLEITKTLDFFHASNVMVNKCKGEWFRLENSNDIIVSQCYLNRIDLTYSNNITFNNNCIIKTGGTSNTFLMDEESSAVIFNNTFTRDNSQVMTIYNSVLHSNVFNYIRYNIANSINSYIDLNTVSIFNNVYDSSNSVYQAFISDNNTNTEAEFDDLFETSSSPDARWKLATNSPAKGAGVNGVDCGAFGGNTPYIPSGIPTLPHIHELNILEAGNSILRVNIKARSAQ